MKKIRQSFAVPFHYDIVFTESVFKPGNTCLADLLSSGPKPGITKALFILDEGVHFHHPQLIADIKLYEAQYRSRFQLAGEVIVVPGGEPVKNDPKYVEEILQRIEEHGIDRHSYVVAIGGGAMLDMAGFAASVAHRGVRLIRVPTTVLSQNDSGVGVKNGINFFGKKNFLGAFDPPYAVINDAAFLLTLNDRDWRAGVAEAIKVSLIKDEAFFHKIEADAEAIVNRSLKAMREQIYRCAELHAEHIRGGDPFEKGSSRPLDFGHWAAHKLEQMTNFELRHGEAVAIGMALDITYSYLAGILDREDYLRVIRLIDKLGFSLYTPELKIDSDRTAPSHPLLVGLEEFREHLGGELTIMLIDGIGHGIEVHEMDADLILKSIRQLEQLSQPQNITSDHLLHI